MFDSYICLGAHGRGVGSEKDLSAAVRGLLARGRLGGEEDAQGRKFYKLESFILMALWQVGFFVLPKESIKNIDSFKVSDEYTFDDSPYWKTKGISPSLFNSIGLFLPQSKSWAEYLTIFGDENSNRFEIFSENNLVESVSFRIDFTSDYEKVLNEIIEFCMLNGLIILDEGLNLVPLNFESANSLIKNAPQVQKYNDLLRNQNLK